MKSINKRGLTKLQQSSNLSSSFNRTLQHAPHTSQQQESLFCYNFDHTLFGHQQRTRDFHSTGSGSQILQSNVDLTYIQFPTTENTSSEIEKGRVDWSKEVSHNANLTDLTAYVPKLEYLINSFKRNIEHIQESHNSVSLSGNTNAHLSMADQISTHYLITAWLVSDNVIVDLYKRVFGVVPNIIAVNTLHLFDSTLTTAELMEKQYYNNSSIDSKKAPKINWFYPEHCATRGDFEKQYGRYDTMKDEEFDYHSKIHPLQTAMKQIPEGSIVVTGRRCDQGKNRVDIPLWEAERNTCNPLSLWSWDDVLLYAQYFSVPVNPLHKRVYVDSFNEYVGSLERDKYKRFLEITLDHPYFYYKTGFLKRAFGITLSDKEKKAMKVHLNSFSDDRSSNLYVWKSFGDFHTSIPITLDDPEREGRFVNRRASECGIHTRVSNTRKSPHGGSNLVNLLPFPSLSNKNFANVAQASQTVEANVEDTFTPDARMTIHGLRVNSELELNERQICDLELLMNGGYTPLKGFMTRLEYESCVEDMRLPEGCLWGLPVVLDTNNSSIQPGQTILLRSKTHGGDLAVMNVTDVWQPSKNREAEKVLGTTSTEHPYVTHMVNQMGGTYIGGPIVKGIQLPKRNWIKQEKILTPYEFRNRYKSFKEIIAFQCRNPIHRAHVAMFSPKVLHHGEDAPVAPSQIPVPTKETPELVVVHPTIGPSKQDDFDAQIRVPTYEALKDALKDNQIHFHYFPYHMRLGGPREAIQHMICRKNYGFTKMIIGRDHAGCKDESGKDFYDPYAAQEIANRFGKELGIDPITFNALVYIPEKDIYLTKEEAKDLKLESINISGTEFRRRINEGVSVPTWYAFPEVVRLLEASFRFHSIENLERAQALANSTDKHAIVLFVGENEDSNSLVDKFVTLSKAYPTVPFFKSEKNMSSSSVGSPEIYVVAPTSKTGELNIPLKFNDLEGLEIHLSKTAE